jgi:hypothetical protein
VKSIEATGGMDFELVSDLANVETIATGHPIGTAKAAALVWQGAVEEDEGQRSDTPRKRPHSAS